ncbi:MAG: hypothetical protein Q9223_003208 [Gallowayella weberi]
MKIDFLKQAWQLSYVAFQYISILYLRTRRQDRACRQPRQFCQLIKELERRRLFSSLFVFRHNDANDMTSVDFAAAQQRVLERQQAQRLAFQSRKSARRSKSALRASSHLPFPLNCWTQKTIRTWDTIKERGGTLPAFRVGQVDAELLDEELLDLLRGQFGQALKYFGSHLRDEWSSEILLALRAILFKLSIWDHNASYGAALQNLQYTDARHDGPLLSAPTRWQKASYGSLSVGGRYAWEKWNVWLANQEGDYERVSYPPRQAG